MASRPTVAARRPSLPALLAGASLGALLATTPARAEPTVPPEMQKRVDAAIEKGAAWLRKQRSPDGSFGAVQVQGAPYYQIGIASLSSLALVAAGDGKDDAGIKKTIDFLRERDRLEASNGSRSTYGTGALLMFLTELYRGRGERTDPRYATRKKDPCGLPKDVAAWVQELASWLVSVQREDGAWRYPHTPPTDLSNTQYALLGLRAARDCGAEVPMSCFQRVLEATLARQEADGPKVRRVVPPEKPGERAYVVDGGDRARGWSYQNTNDRVTGSMTTAGIAVLAICRDALLRPTRWAGYTDESDRKVGRAVQDGFAWLDKNWAVDCNPPRGSPSWHYYYLYGLERACVYAGRDHVGEHDWYAEGAKLLLDQQKPEGRWSTGALGLDEIGASDLADTAWAILFLKKATRPLQPIPAPVVTGK